MGEQHPRRRGRRRLDGAVGRVRDAVARGIPGSGSGSGGGHDTRDGRNAGVQRGNVCSAVMRLRRATELIVGCTEERSYRQRMRRRGRCGRLGMLGRANLVQEAVTCSKIRK